MAHALLKTVFVIDWSNTWLGFWGIFAKLHTAYDILYFSKNQYVLLVQSTFSNAAHDLCVSIPKILNRNI